MSILNTEEWRLAIFAEYRPAVKPAFISCERCGGTGEIGGHFKDIEGPRTCNQCHGTRGRYQEPKTPKPEVPQSLIEHMRRAYQEYCAAQQQQRNGGE